MSDFEYILKLLGFSALVLVCCSFSCNDEPLGPVEPTEYPFYLSYTNSPKLSVFHPNTLTMDTTTLPWYPYAGVTVSSNGKLLYIAQGTSVVVVDADSFSFVAELPYFSQYPIAVSPDNQLLAITGDELIILRASDYSIVFKDTTRGEYLGGTFSSDSKRFYCPLSAAYMVFKVDLSDTLFPVTVKSIGIGDILQIIPSIDESKWFLLHYCCYGGPGTFEVYDVLNDSIIFQEYPIPGAGGMALSPDGELLYYTTPGDFAYTTTEMSFRVFDVDRNEIDTIIDNPSFYCDSSGCSPPAKVSISPEGKWLGILGGGMGIYEFFVFDLKENKPAYRADQKIVPAGYTSISVQNSK